MLLVLIVYPTNAASVCRVDWFYSDLLDQVFARRKMFLFESYSVTVSSSKIRFLQAVEH